MTKITFHADVIHRLHFHYGIASGKIERIESDLKHDNNAKKKCYEQTRISRKLEHYERQA